MNNYAILMKLQCHGAIRCRVRWKQQAGSKLSIMLALMNQALAPVVVCQQSGLTASVRQCDARHVTSVLSLAKGQRLGVFSDAVLASCQKWQQ